MGKPLATREAVELVADLLYEEVPTSRGDLRNWKNGRAPWDSIIPIVKKHIRFALQDHVVVKAATRAAFNHFAVEYGLTVRKGAHGDEPLTVVSRQRWGASQWGALEKAAELAGVTVVEYIRNVTMAQVYRDIDSGQKESAA